MRSSVKIISLFVTLTVIVAATPVELSSGLTPLQQMFIMKELKPGMERVGILWSSSLAGREELKTQIQRASGSTGIQVYIAELGDIKDVAPMYRDLVRSYDVQAIWIVEDDGIVDTDIGRGFLIKNATKSGLPVFAPTEEWVNQGATVNMVKAESGVQLVVNKAAAEATSVVVPEKYVPQTQFLAAN